MSSANLKLPMSPNRSMLSTKKLPGLNVCENVDFYLAKSR